MNAARSRTPGLVAAAIAAWLGGLITGSETLHAVAGTLIALPAVAAVAMRQRRRALRLEVRRATGTSRVAPGQSVDIEIEVHNRGGGALPLLVVTDQLPDALGGPRRVVVDGIPGRARARATYRIEAGARGRFPLGPVRIDIPGPFGLAPISHAFDARDTLVVVPRIEDLDDRAGAPRSPSDGAARSLLPMRGIDDFSAMRPYQEGDDLRRIHWPSVARRGELMIRQDERATRARSVVFMDTRIRSAGPSGSPTFERVVSAAASVGVHFVRGGAALRVATTLLGPRPADEASLLDLLAGIEPDGAMFGAALGALRSVATADTTLVAVMPVPDAADTVSLTRLGVQFGPRVALLVRSAVGPGTTRDAADAAALSLSRAGWEVALLTPDRGLGDAWRARIARGRMAPPA